MSGTDPFGLEDLFDTSDAPADRQDGAAAARDSAGSGLGDLNELFGAADHTAAEPSSSAVTPVPEVLFGAGAKQPSVLEAAARFAALVPGSDVPLSPAAESERSAQPVDVSGSSTPTPSEHSAAGGPRRKASRLSQARASMDAAETDLARPEQTWLDQIEHVQRERERLATTITAVLGAISAEPAVSHEVGQWRLTRDHDLYAEQRQNLERLLGSVLHQHGVSIGNPRDTPAVLDAVYDELVGIGPLGEVWRDDEITEILVDGWDRVAVERDGSLHLTPIRFRDKEHAARLARDLATSVSDRALNITNPLVTAELERARASFAYGPVVKSGLSISIRKFRPLLQMDALLERGALSADMIEFLRQCVAARATLLVSGGTGTGKTTMLNALSEYIPDHERVVTIEDSFELSLSNQHVVSLQTKERASADDTVRITLADLLVNALRMRPDRIVVGEIREPNGARAMLQAATTGHDGTMTTIHANTPTMALSDRLSDLQREATGAPDEVCKRTVATAVDLVVQVLRKHGKRFISEIAVVDRSMVRDGDIVAETVFFGDVDADGAVTFRHAGSVRADTDLGHKLVDAGFSLGRWQVAHATQRHPAQSASSAAEGEAQEESQQGGSL